MENGKTKAQSIFIQRFHVNPEELYNKTCNILNVIYVPLLATNKNPLFLFLSFQLRLVSIVQCLAEEKAVYDVPNNDNFKYG